MGTRAFGSIAWLMYPFTEAKMEWKNDFYGPMDNPEALINWNGNQPVCVINKNWKHGVLIKMVQLHWMT